MCGVRCGGSREAVAGSGEYDVVGAGRRYTPVSESHMYCERRQLTI